MTPRQTATDPTTALTDKERQTLGKSLANPLDFPPEFLGWLDDFIRLRLSASNVTGLAGRTGQVGELLVVLKNYSYQTGFFTINHAGSRWAYLNGATIPTTGYEDLVNYLGATLPDTRGRSLWMCGTIGATAYAANDGVAEASRQPKHQHTDTKAVGSGGTHTHGMSGAPGGSFASNSHTHTDGSVAGQTGTGANFAPAGGVSSGPSAVASPTVGTLAVASDGLHGHSLSGAVGSGMAGSDAVAHIVIGSAFVHT